MAKISPVHMRQAFDYLLNGPMNGPDSEPKPPLDIIWRWLEAAHVLGQASLPLHLRAHTAMLHLAWAQGNGREVMGQLLRLALVPLGHLAKRLPAGNSGRAHVSAFNPMDPPAEVTALIQQALDETRQTAS
ncbi:MAG: DUF3703 domain-containing protein [Acidovorax sp.]|nr:DUF3703 domain-containing protein [Acidovorax sp.]